MDDLSPVSRTARPAGWTSPALTEFHEFPQRDHWTCAAPGWEAVADHALTWALTHARAVPAA